jgi:hypothetical protein
VRNACKIATQEENVAEIKKHIQRLLKAAGVGNRLPTPKEDIVECAKLVAVGKLDLAQYEETWPKGQWNVIKDLLERTISKIKGLVHLKENIIYVDPLLHPSSVPFVTYHEVTHKILPGHSILSNPHLDDDLTLDPEFARGLEIEANIGAALILFQVDRFAKEIRDVPLGIASAMHFAQRYEASFHSAFRHYVEVNDRPCTILVLNNPDEIFDRNCFPLRYSLSSKEFDQRFGVVDWGNYFFEGHAIYDTILNRRGEEIPKGNLKLKDRLGFKVECTFEVFHNFYNYFVLCYPKSQSRKGRKLVVVKSLGELKS